MNLTVPKVLAWLAIALVVVYLFRSPAHTVDVLRGAGAVLVALGRSLVSFVGSLL